MSWLPYIPLLPLLGASFCAVVALVVERPRLLAEDAKARAGGDDPHVGTGVTSHGGGDDTAPSAGYRTLVSFVAPGSVLLAFAASVAAFLDLASRPVAERTVTLRLADWIAAGNLDAPVSILYDPLSAVMALVVTGVGFLVHIYSVGYMAHERAYARYFFALNLFTAAMLILVLGGNYPLIFVGWEGVGLCSYLLIGFWYGKGSASDAGRKAFIVNRIGDLGFLLGVFLLFATLGTVDLATVSAKASSGLLPTDVATAAALLLFVGACGKSAQFPLHVWLPDAMEGPTPVSALIHAATMVTAGVYLVARSHAIFLLSPTAMAVVACVGVFTALFAATVAVAQDDIKRVLAWSTVSQLGFMTLACGVGAFSAGIFHLVTHAFFKALLFLCAGSVIYALSGAQDLRRMGGLRSKLPVTFATMAVGVLAIAGIPGLSGFFSKDAILWEVFSSAHGSPLLWGVGAATALLTAFYMTRMFVLAFLGPTRMTGTEFDHAHESPSTMTVPLILLAILAACGGFLGIPASLGGSDLFARWLSPVFATATATAHAAAAHSSEASEHLMTGIASGIALAGVALGWRLYSRLGSAERDPVEARAPGVRATLAAAYRIDAFYDAIVVHPLIRLAAVLSSFVDAKIVDGAVNGVARLVGRVGERVRNVESGLISHYAIGMLLGAVALIGWMVTR